jgi:hypothetical protein
MSEEEVWTCEGCSKEFLYEKDALNHEKICSSLKIADSEFRDLLKSIDNRLGWIERMVIACAVLYALRTFA